MKRSHLLRAILAIFCGHAAGDDTDDAKAWQSHGFSDAQRESVRAAFRWGMEQHFIPGGALLIVHRGVPVFREAFGVTDMETGRPFTADTPCRIASLTKPHTATLLAMLVDQGQLSWDDPVDKYLPAFSKLAVKGKGPATRPPKLRELLSHTAGFASNADRPGADAGIKLDGTLADAVDALASEGLVTEPGTVYAYTGAGYMVAGRIAEVVTGEEFGALMSERLLKPVGATTAVFQSAASPALTGSLPTIYQREAGRLVKADLSGRPEAKIRFPSPGGGLISTLDDVARVLLLHRDHGVVAGKSLIAAETLQAQYRAQPATGRIGYGLGFNIMHADAKGAGDRIRHIGASGTLALLDFNQDAIVVLLTQVSAKQTQPFTDRVMKAVSAVFAR